MTDLRIPTVHLNGTSKQELLKQVCDALDAVHEAITALAHATPNGRDYYPQGGEAIREALQQHEDRMVRLRSVSNELEQIALAIEEQ